MGEIVAVLASCIITAGYLTLVGWIDRRAGRRIEGTMMEGER